MSHPERESDGTPIGCGAAVLLAVLAVLMWCAVEVCGWFARRAMSGSVCGAVACVAAVVVIARAAALAVGP